MAMARNIHTASKRSSQPRDLKIEDLASGHGLLSRESSLAGDFSMSEFGKCDGGSRFDEIFGKVV
jgi:hypothetical protein